MADKEDQCLDDALASLRFGMESRSNACTNAPLPTNIQLQIRENFNKQCLTEIRVSTMLFTTILFDSVVFSLASAVGLVSLVFYFSKKKTGLLMIAIAFLLSAFPGVFNGATITE